MGEVGVQAGLIFTLIYQADQATITKCGPSSPLVCNSVPQAHHSCHRIKILCNSLSNYEETRYEKEAQFLPSVTALLIRKLPSAASHATSVNGFQKALNHTMSELSSNPSLKGFLFWAVLIFSSWGLDYTDKPMFQYGGQNISLLLWLLDELCTLNLDTRAMRRFVSPDVLVFGFSNWNF